MTLDEERDRAMLARREANAMRRRQHAVDNPLCSYCGHDRRWHDAGGHAFTVKAEPLDGIGMGVVARSLGVY